MKRQWMLVLPIQSRDGWFHVSDLIQAEGVHEKIVEYDKTHGVKVYCFWDGGSALWKLNTPQKLAAVGWWLKDKVGAKLKIRMFVKDKVVATVGLA